MINSIELFNTRLQESPEWLVRTLRAAQPERVSQIADSLRKAKRIFCTGSGSSIPAASFLAEYSSAKLGFSAQFVSTSQLLVTSSLKAGDVVVLVSQGMNRSDAMVIYKRVVDLHAKLIIISAKELGDEILGLRFFPEYLDERLFCRPAGVISAFGAIAKIISELENVSLEEAEGVRGIASGVTQAEKASETQLLSEILSQKRALILCSGLMMPVVGNLAVALREGAAIDADLFEIESYAHGQYVPHLRNKEGSIDPVFIAISFETDSVSVKAVNRISPLFNGINKKLWQFHFTGDWFEAGCSVLALGGKIVSEILARTEYDMNSPRGMEENRGFHMVADDYY